VGSGEVTLRIFKPIATDGLTLKDRGILTNRLRDLIAAELQAEGFGVRAIGETVSPGVP
jgi:hypothetical protein